LRPDFEKKSTFWFTIRECRARVRVQNVINWGARVHSLPVSANAIAERARIGFSVFRCVLTSQQLHFLSFLNTQKQRIGACKNSSPFWAFHISNMSLPFHSPCRKISLINSGVASSYCFHNFHVWIKLRTTVHSCSLKLHPQNPRTQTHWLTKFTKKVPYPSEKRVCKNTSAFSAFHISNISLPFHSPCRKISLINSVIASNYCFYNFYVN